MQTQWPWDITGRRWAERRWPKGALRGGDTNDAQQPEIADFFAELNELRIKAAPRAGDEMPFVITMSHFVPRQADARGAHVATAKHKPWGLKTIEVPGKSLDVPRHSMRFKLTRQALVMFGVPGVLSWPAAPMSGGPGLDLSSRVRWSHGMS